MKSLFGIILAASFAFAGEPTKPRVFGPKEILTTAVEITIKPTRERGEATFQAGSPVRMLRDDGTNCVILIGDSLEQAIVPKSAIKEAGGTAGPAIKARSIQWPASVSTVNADGPSGGWTGIATGDENVASSNPSFEQEVFRLINAERTKRGLTALTWDEDLARAARYQAADMYAQQYQDRGEHTTQDVYIQNGEPRWIVRDDVKSRITRFSPSGKGENIAGYPGAPAGPQMWVAAWMASPGHRENILRSAFTKTGIGFATGRDGNPRFGSRLVQVFGR